MRTYINHRRLPQLLPIVPISHVAMIHPRRHPHPSHRAKESLLALLVLGRVLEESAGLVVVERNAKRRLAEFLRIGVLLHGFGPGGVGWVAFFGEVAHPVPHYGVIDEDRGDGGVDDVVGLIFIKDLVHGGLSEDGGNTVFGQASLLGYLCICCAAFKGDGLREFEAVDYLDYRDVD